MGDTCREHQWTASKLVFGLVTRQTWVIKPCTVLSSSRTGHNTCNSAYLSPHVPWLPVGWVGSTSTLRPDTLFLLATMEVKHPHSSPIIGIAAKRRQEGWRRTLSSFPQYEVCERSCDEWQARLNKSIVYRGRYSAFSHMVGSDPHTFARAEEVKCTTTASVRSEDRPAIRRTIGCVRVFHTYSCPSYNLGRTRT